MRDLIKRRNEAGREWRRELVGVDPICMAVGDDKIAK